MFKDVCLKFKRPFHTLKESNEIVFSHLKLFSLKMNGGCSTQLLPVGGSNTPDVDYLLIHLTHEEEQHARNSCEYRERIASLKSLTLTVSYL